MFKRERSDVKTDPHIDALLSSIVLNIMCSEIAKGALA